MKVITLISGGDTGGAKTHVHSLLQGLQKHIEAHMVCFTEGPFTQEARELGIPTEVITGHNIFRTVSILRKKIIDGHYDIIHCHGARGNLIGSMLRRSTGLPVVSTIHSDYRLDYLGRPFSRLTYGTLNAIALRKLDYYIGVSDAMVDQLIERHFDPQRIFSIYNGLDFTPRPVAMDRETFFRSLDFPVSPEDVVVGIAARLNPVKDISTLIRGFAKAHAAFPRLKLAIAGDGEEMDSLKRLAKELGVEKDVCFAGWLSDVDSFYHALDINTLTSLSETFPYSLTEGARAQRPTVASRVGGVPYLIEHGVTGLLFDPGDSDALAHCLQMLCESADLRERLGQQLYQRAKTDFSLESTIQKQMKIYEDILRLQARPRRKRDGAIICGAYGRGNAGDDAILEAIIAEMRQIDRDMPIWVLSRNPKATRLAYRVNTIYTFHMPAFLRRMRKSALYINGGGSLMQDATSRRSLWFYLLTISSARRMGCKVMMYGCGIGPIRHPSNRRRAAQVMNRCVDIITLRDSHSRQELADMGVTAPEILLSADPTVILPAAPREAAEGLLESQGLDPKAHFLGISVRPWPGFRDRAPIFAQAIDYVYETYGLIPVFLPIEARLDTDAAEHVASFLTKAPRHIMPACDRSASTIGLFARMDTVLSMRLHALIFSASHSVPLVGVVYDQKVSSFLESVGQNLYMDLRELSAGALCAMLDKAIASGRDREQLTRSVERLRELERHNIQAARRLLDLEQETAG